ncbi:MAG: hypothetical protein AVDCRST_MAG30-616 [uncultured Solirubrobacteraceae bacterium]|uniref:Pyrrolo-quinoline quinone repeat domain-containing protein n=1 Tax=uncultured Solirubrobacteraceae bacterium TaxID=1162706 RepID=A0A6J4RUP5_9ACTN|nr:MAG: hypothetical protein AVDCRST_MAG30-616 [uncultured Solirubrobacteraceae bacterium]
MGSSFPPELAFGEGRVIAGGGGVVRALDAVTGAVAWTVPAGQLVRLTVAGGDVLFEVDEREEPSGDPIAVLRAVEIATGKVRWERRSSEGFGLADPLVAGDRVYRAEGCVAAAFDRRNGQPIWSRELGCSSNGDGSGYVDTRMSGLTLAAGSRLLDSRDGNQFGTAPGPLDALAGEVGLGPAGEGTVGATELGGRRLWTLPMGDYATIARSTAVNDTAVLAADADLRVVDRGTGAVRWQGLVLGDKVERGDARAPVAGAGVIVVPFESELLVLAPAARGPAPPLKAKADKDVIVFGSTLRIEGQVGTDLGTVTPLEVEVDRGAGRGFERLPAGETNPDGSFVVKDQPERFTRYRVAAAGAAGKPVIPVGVLPRYRSRVRRGRGDPNALTTSVSVLLPKGVRAKGRILGAYVGRAKTRRYTRLDTTRLTGRRERFRGVLRFRAQRLGNRDVLVFCVSGLVRQGIGVGDKLDRRCGSRRIPY